LEETVLNWYLQAGFGGIVAMIVIYQVVQSGKIASKQQEQLQNLAVELEQQSTIISNLQNIQIKNLDKWARVEDRLISEIHDLSDDLKEMKGILSSK
tara:strand:+ start:2612 stop:2902 length:291 start_codon:yes stop_codon:yes gene_type:complete